MWTRQELKRKGKNAFKKNYWKCVLISSILTLLSGGLGLVQVQNFSTGFSNRFVSVTDNNTGSAAEDEASDTDDLLPEEEEVADEEENLIGGFINSIAESIATDIDVDENDGEIADDEEILPVTDTALIMITFIVFAIVFCVIFLISFAIGVLLDTFIYNPLQMGPNRFFLTNLHEKANVKEFTFAFDHSYKNIIKVLFFRDLYIFQWALLFIIPGIVKSYEYRMIPYILSENPSMERKEVFALSKKMMTGQKWKAFVLDLSFIGWNILSSFTSGLLGIFYVRPYQNMTNAALYEALKQNIEYPAEQPMVYGLNTGDK
jgi:hypothetical protein